jgi:hypothetical protein
LPSLKRSFLVPVAAVPVWKDTPPAHQSTQQARTLLCQPSSQCQSSWTITTKIQ